MYPSCVAKSTKFGENIDQLSLLKKFVLDLGYAKFGTRGQKYREAWISV